MPNFATLALSTERLCLRPLSQADVEPLFAIFSDPRVMRYWSTPPWTERSSAQELIDTDAKAMPLGEHLRFGIEIRETAQLIGTCCLFELNAQCKRAELGYGMAFDAWGKGYMQEALRAVLTYGFTELELNRVEADIDPRNERSGAVLERLGFVREGYLRERWIVADEVSDSALYGLLKKDWLGGILHSK